MNLALSKFTVANGLEGAVREAFLNRPHQVDSAPGFLGMEVFTVTADPKTFQLVTRWTDAAAFHAWHSSPAHRQAHQFMPAGLKLVPGSTEVAVFDRIGDDECGFDKARLLGPFLAQSEVVHYLTATREGTVLTCNAEVARALKRDLAAVVGTPLSSHLTQADAVTLQKLLSDGTVSRAESFLLNFMDANHAPYTVRCRVDVQPAGVTLIGEPPRREDEALQTQLLELNNELAAQTRENVRKSRELAQALTDLQATQAMLVHREKMASLGQMTAGVAHEINNPVAFVYNNQSTLNRDFNEVTGFVNLVATELPALQTACPAVYDRLAASWQALEWDYLARSIPKKLADNLDGLRRVRQIVLDLRSFSRLDEKGWKSCDLAESIRATVRFLGPLAKPRDVQVELQLAELPPVLCEPGPLNQAISNIVANAIQASPPGQTVSVRTLAAGADYIIEVADHGGGIAPEHLPKIFDPFFTTKPVGEGTGLGLSITHQVVKAHGGEIRFQTQVGAGTTVQIQIPCQPKESHHD